MPPVGLIGRSVDAWDALLRAKPAEGAKMMAALQAEILTERRALDTLDVQPWYRRYASVAPHDLSPSQGRDLQREIDGEQRLATRVAEAMRRARLPAQLGPFVDDTTVELQPDSDGEQFAGFSKYSGVRQRRTTEVVTLFAADAAAKDAASPNFFGRYDPKEKRFSIDRAFRTELPRGSGTDIVAEQIRRCCDPSELEHLVVANVANSATFDSFVDSSTGETQLRTGVELESTPLGRFARRVLERLGLEISTCEPQLSFHGQLTLDLSLRPSA